MIVQVASNILGKQYSSHQSGTRFIVSCNLDCETPSEEDLGYLVSRMQDTGADIIKLVVSVNEITEIARIFQLLSHCQV